MSKCLPCHSKHLVVSNEDLDKEDNVPAPLNLPFGQLFFGYNIPAYVAPEPKAESVPSQVPYHRIYRLLVLTDLPAGTFHGQWQLLDRSPEPVFFLREQRQGQGEREREVSYARVGQ